MMNHSFYRYGIFFSVLASLSGLFQTFFIFRIGSQTYMLPSFTGWFVSGSIIAIIGAGILIRYYDKKDYTLAYSTAVISTAATVILHLIIYNMLRSREPSGFYIPVYLLTLVASMVYAAVLVFSDAGKRPWLRVAGVWFFLVLATVFSLIIWATFFGSMQATPWSETVNKWASLAGSLIPLLFAVNFVTELRTAGREDAPALRSRLQQLGVALLIVVAVVMVAIKFGKEAFHGLAAIPVVVTPTERQIAEPFEARVYVNADGDTLRYRFMRPLDYDPQKEYPLVVCLHHGGTHGTDNVRQVNGSPAALLLSRGENKLKYPAFLFLPQCPQGASFGGTIFPPIDSLVFEGLRAFENEFNIDAKRRYVTGVSGGGYGSWHFISTRPEMFAAAIPVCGGANPRLASNAKEVPVWAFHGENDRNVPVALSRDMIDAIKEVGGDPRYTEYDDAGHDIWNRVRETPGLMEWMFSHRRE